MKKIFIQCLCTGLILAAFSNNALAALMVSSPAVTPISSTPTDWNTVLQFPKFNPALGTLISFELDLTSTLNTSLSITNNSASASHGTAKTETLLSVQDVGALLTFPQIDLVSPAYTYSLAPGQNSVSPLLTTTGTSSNIYSSLPILAEFTGVGNITLNASTFTQTLLSNSGGNTFASQISFASANGTVIYTYNPVAVPEPGTALFGVACVGIAAFRRRRIS